MRKIFLLLCIPLFTTCGLDELTETTTAKVVLEVTCNATPFEVRYDNEYDNWVTETSDSDYWIREFDKEIPAFGTTQYLDLNSLNLQSGEIDAYLRIGYKGNTVVSFDGKVSSSGKEISADLN